MTAWRGQIRASAILGYAGSVTGLAVLLALWQLLPSVIPGGGLVLPTPLTVLAQMWSDRALYPPNVATTLAEAGTGWLWGSLAAVGVAMLAVLLPPLAPTLQHLAIASYCLPIVAIGPILQIVLDGNTPKSVLAALAVFFTTLIGTLVGLRSADTTALEVVRGFGGGRLHELAKVRVKSALPSLFAALRIAGPGALLGAVIGEYLGGQSGLGVAMVQSMQSLEVARTWGLTLVTAALAGLLYAVTALAGRLLTPWASSTPLPIGLAPTGAAPGRPVPRAVRPVLLTLVSVGLLLGIWLGFIRGLGLNPYFAKSPQDVWDYLTASPDAGAHRGELWDALGLTLRDAALGFAAGIGFAVASAAACVMSPAIERAFMPVAIVLRTLPLIAITPLVALAVGQGTWCVIVIVAVSTYFPTLVNVAHGLRSVPADTLALMTAYDASRWTLLRKVRLYTALPELFASVRIAVPSALLGALVAEWLATGNGLGYLMVQAGAAARYDTVWASVAVVTALAALLFGATGLLERAVNALLNTR